jgi:hypothetical protein
LPGPEDGTPAYDNLTTKEVPFAWEVSGTPPTRVGRIAADSVCRPGNLRESAFCSHAMLQTRRSLHGPKNKISNPIFAFENNLLVVVSSDSQVGHKFGNDTPAALRIIKG